MHNNLSKHVLALAVQVKPLIVHLLTDNHMGSSEYNGDRRSSVSAHVITGYAITAEVKKLNLFGQSRLF